METGLPNVDLVSESNVKLHNFSNGGHWRAFRKKSNEQFQDQWLQQVNVYIPFMY